MRHGSLFTGIGGFDLAAKWLGWENVFQCEIDTYCQKILKQHFPEAELHDDIKTFDAKKYRDAVDIISGGFPCQPYSIAGKQRGAEDDRNLWPEMFRIIKEVRPAWVVAENVANIKNFVEFENACADLEGEGYEVQSFIIPAVGVGAWHRRDRVWIVAYTNENRCNRKGVPISTRNKEKGVLPSR
ncbi:MAG: DNA (cytosine-5-)-methyltransferase, partial [Chloroflexi bacterium]